MFSDKSRALRMLRRVWRRGRERDLKRQQVRSGITRSISGTNSLRRHRRKSKQELSQRELFLGLLQSTNLGSGSSVVRRKLWRRRRKEWDGSEERCSSEEQL